MGSGKNFQHLVTSAGGQTQSTTQYPGSSELRFQDSLLLQISGCLSLYN